MEKWLRLHPGQAVTQFQVAELFGKTYGRAATVGTAINGFARAGIPVVEEVPVAKDTSTGTKTTAPRTTVATSSITEKISAVEATTSTQKTSTVGAAASTNTAAINPMCEKVPGAEATGNESAGGAATQIKVTEGPGKDKNFTDSCTTTVASTRGKKGTQKALVLTSSPYKQQLSKSSTGLKRKKLTYPSSEDKKVRRSTNNDWYCEMCQNHKDHDCDKNYENDKDHNMDKHKDNNKGKDKNHDEDHYMGHDEHHENDHERDHDIVAR
ncbi:hypothetical protein ANN_21433 [Periplaneta americana]|uniref:Uncharacterized protein n=1 Tax=Periplaneta americana TaxID=6978 RepID=A0ABQ8SF98_PERAM|nr:hypothetical protein ANN_21433 [Periplaneta americana]